MRGFVRVAAAVPPLHLGDLVANTKEIIRLMEAADQNEADVVVFPELALSGKTLGDLYGAELVQKQALAGLLEIAKEAQEKRPIYFVGAPITNEGVLVDATAVVSAPELGDPVIRLLAARRDFSASEAAGALRAFHGAPPEESRLYVPNATDPENPLIDASVSQEGRIGVYTPGGSEIYRMAILYPSDLEDVALLGRLAAHNYDLLVVPAAEPTTVGSQQRLEAKLAALSELGFAVVYAGAGEGESGQSAYYAGERIIAAGGRIMARGGTLGRPTVFAEKLDDALRSKADDGEILYYDIDLDWLRVLRARRNKARGVFANPEESKAEWTFTSVDLPGACHPRPLFTGLDPKPLVPEDPAGLEEILQIQARGVARRLRHLGAKDVWIGLSGGLDSTLTFLVALRAFALLDLDRQGVHLVSMPAFGTGTRTRSNARSLGEKSGCDFREILLTEVLTRHFADIGLEEGDRSVAFENAQARERTQILMDLANLHGGLHLGTGDLSETALGWSTYNGDQMSMYNPNGSIPKTLAQALVRYEADRLHALSDVLHDIVDTPISPELLPGKDGTIEQKTEDIVGPYALHDFFLYHAVLGGAEPERLLVLAELAFGAQYDRATILQVLRIFFRRLLASQYKRQPMADGVATGVVNLSPHDGWMAPSDVSSALWMAELDRLEKNRSEDDAPGEQA